VSSHHPGRLFTRVKIYSSQGFGVTDRDGVKDTLTSNWRYPGYYSRAAWKGFLGNQVIPLLLCSTS
jgi:hypothetical protein